jgi:hypothetical protein
MLNRPPVKKDTLEMIRGLGNSLDIRFNVIYGLPGDSLRQYVKTLDYLIDLQPTRITMSRLLLLPGSEFNLHPDLYGIKSKDGHVVDYTSTFSREQIKAATKATYYVNIFFGNRLLKRFIYYYSKGHALIKGYKQPRYVQNIVNYFDFIDRKTRMRMDYTFEDLEESSPEGTKLSNFDKTIANIQKKKHVIVARSVEFCLKQVRP